MSDAAPERLWDPPRELRERARMTEFIAWLRAERGLELNRYEELWRWSVDDLDGFWSAIWEFFDVQADGDPGQVLGSREMPGAEWFADTRLNYAEHVFAGKDDAETAILHASELRELGELSWGELRRQVAAVAAGLRGLGVEPGDRVVAYMPNIPEAIVAFLAAAEHRRHLVELLARLRPGERDRPLRPDRAEGPVRGRRLPLWRPRLRSQRDRRRAAGGDAEPGADGRPPLPRLRPRPRRPRPRDSAGTS